MIENPGQDSILARSEQLPEVRAFFIEHRKYGTVDKIDTHWGHYADMQINKTLKSAVDNLKTVPCWTDGDKLEICMIYKYNKDLGMFISTDHDHFADPVPLEAEDLL